MFFCRSAILLVFFPAPPGSTPGGWRVYCFGGRFRSRRQALQRTDSVTKVAVFIDYQNIYHGARHAFAGAHSDSPTFGHVDPVALAQLLTGIGRIIDSGRVLWAVTVYRGEPGRMSHPKLRVAFGRQTSRWRSESLLTVKTTPLRYRRVDRPGGRAWRAEEKGIDVLLAVDVVRGAYLNEFDTAVVASADTDLLPALKEALRAGKRVETASWFGPVAALRVPGHRTWCRHLSLEHFGLVQDATDHLAR